MTDTRSTLEPPPPAGTVGAPATDVIQRVNRIDRAIKARRDSDDQLVNWWLYFLVLSWVTFGVYGIYVYVKRIGRIDAFSRRKRDYYSAVIEWTRRQANASGREELYHHDLNDLDAAITGAYSGALRPIRPGRSFVLSLVTLGIYGLVVLYRLNRYWWDAQVLEQDFDDAVSQLWTKLGLVRYPLTYRLDQSKRRSFGLYLVLSFVTFGIWGLVWDHKIHTDPDRLFPEFHNVEDTVLQTVRAY